MRVLSGIQPSGKLHIGNFFGMMKPAIELQEKGDAFLFIANYHALTTVTDGDQLRADTLNVALDYLACGLDPERTMIYRQSDVPEVTELTWLLSTVTGMGLLERCHSYKDKIAKGITPSHALFSYPVLMAADILAVQANTVPVGRDQKQHVEVTRDIAIRFNNLFGDVFTIPEPSILESVAVIPGIDGQKMSKSYDNHIELFGEEKATRKRVMRIVTDSTPLEEPKDPTTCNVFNLYKLFASASECEEMVSNYATPGFGYGTAKAALFDAMWSYLEPYRRKREELASNMDYVEQALETGAKVAREEARKTLNTARKAMGLD